MKHRTSLTLAAMALAVGLGAWYLPGKFTTGGKSVEVLDPARVEFIRTPGGFLQVGEMRKVEEFGWQTAWECPVVDCSKLPKTVSRIRVKAQYVYRIPLAAEWRLEPEGDHYKLTVPPLQLQRPVAFDTASMEIVTTEQGVFSPAAAPNRENAVRHLGPELAQRGASLAYMDAQQKPAEQTVTEFARKWMLEQGRKSDRPIKVVFNGP
ncbi:MAG TPA: hypothetical protein VNB23_02325, partial [Ramlibacter sp.]|nr:hypothetical protein [Ramlibacter sp.]